MAQPFKLKGLDHVVLRVRDMEKALDFYCTVLGCTVERSLPAYGMTQLRAGSALIDLVDRKGPWGRAAGWKTPGEKAFNVDHICLALDRFDARALRTHLARHDIAIVEEGNRYGAGGTGPSFYVRDPDGNQIELKGPPRQRKKRSLPSAR